MNKDQEMHQELLSLCDTHGWNLKPNPGENTLPLLLSKEDKAISVYKSPITEERTICVESTNKEVLRHMNHESALKQVKLLMNKTS